MKRQSYLERGWDCFEVCTDPRHKDTYGRPYRSRSQNHGRRSDEWVYAVTEDGCTMELEVAANEATAPFPGSSFRWEGPPRANCFTGHYPFPVSEEQARDMIPASRECKYTGGVCYMTDRAYNPADLFFKQYGVPRFEQPETFWLALEQIVARVWFADARELALQQCPTCKGKGVVPK
jgi:hypothetical protein